MTNQFRHPKDLAEAPKISMSIRINPKTKQELEKYADKYGIPVSVIVSSVLDDYVRFLHASEKKE